MGHSVIRDVTQQYVSSVICRNDPAAYERAYPALFEHYRTFWSGGGAYTERDTALVLRQRETVVAQLPTVEAALKAAGLDCREISVVLFVGTGAANGHAFEDHGEFVVWIPVETYATELQADIFLTHEIVHALHYRASPDCYFRSPEEKNSIARQIVTEGIATYATACAAGCDDITALWADYIPRASAASWFRRCETSRRDLCAYALERFASSDPCNSFFTAADSGDPSHCRGGYYVGLNVVRTAAERDGLSLQELVALRRADIESRVRNVLRDYSR